MRQEIFFNEDFLLAQTLQIPSQTNECMNKSLMDLK